LQAEAGRLKPERERLDVRHAEFDLGFDGHRQQPV